MVGIGVPNYYKYISTRKSNVIAHENVTDIEVTKKRESSSTKDCVHPKS
jgi:hypothetical protein